jgi:predicted GNAT family acetyltransferase
MESIRQVFDGKKGSFFYELDGIRMGEMAYVMAGDHQMIIDHTVVDEALKGQGIGKRLQAELVSYVREHAIKVIPLCPFAKATFQKTKEWQDVLA